MKGKRLTIMALLTAVALIMFTVEAQIPSPVPIPGVKLGLANIITVYAMFTLGPADTLPILLARVLLGSMFSGSMVTLIYSLSGGLLCYLVMLLLRKLLTLRQIWVCGVIGAIFHNVGQTLAAIAVYRTLAVAAYFPLLVVSGIITGLFTGLCAQFLVQRMGPRV
mgnify:CR=1 FL=1